MNIFLEALLIGLVASIFGLVISTLIMYIHDKNFSLKNYGFWPYVFLSFFIVGAGTHLLFEVFGWNQKYCENKLTKKLT